MPTDWQSLIAPLAQAANGPGTLDTLLRLTGVTTTGALLAVIYLWLTRKIRTEGETNDAIKVRDERIKELTEQNRELQKEVAELWERAWEGARLAGTGAQAAKSATQAMAVAVTQTQQQDGGAGGK